jgi:hypothetical protein
MGNIHIDDSLVICTKLLKLRIKTASIIGQHRPVPTKFAKSEKMQITAVQNENKPTWEVPKKYSAANSRCYKWKINPQKKKVKS